MASANEAVSAERKGAVYEAFVAVALERAFGGSSELATALKGVIADQDVIYPSAASPTIVVGVTHWGSHEAAKMKFWRIHEDFFEVRAAFPTAVFFSVVFERNEASDRNLCALIEHFLGGCAVSDINCEAIADLQSEVATADLLGRFGAGRQSIREYVDSLVKSDRSFRNTIDRLGAELRKRRDAFSPGPELQAQWRRGLKKTDSYFRDPGDREVQYKPALICLIDVGNDISTVIAHAGDWSRLSLNLKQRLLSKELIVEDPYSLDANAFVVSPQLQLLIERGTSWCEGTLSRVRMLVSDTGHPFYSLRDHIEDVVDGFGCQRRISLLMACQSVEELYRLLGEWGEGMQRCWPLDYSMAIERAHTLAGEYGMQKLSNELRIRYIGGISPLPKFAGGDKAALSNEQRKSLAKVLMGKKRAWNRRQVTIDVIQRDRRITLMKKLPVLDMVLEAELRSRIPDVQFERAVRVRHPSHLSCANRSAGATDFNFCTSGPNGKVWIFVAATYETTHKHKEVSGRLRGAMAAGSIVASDTCLLLIDGNLLKGGDRVDRIRMLRAAGWQGAFFLDECDALASAIRTALSKKSSRASALN